VRKILILSDGPVPTPEHTKVEGGGLRCWGLAQGLKQNNQDIEITVAYNKNHAKLDAFTDNYEGIQIATWELETIPQLLHGFDSVIVSYCMGMLSVTVAQAINVNQQLVLDCYVPIYIEVSARQSNDIEGEYGAFHGDIGRWSAVLLRGDIFLCASEAQKDFYRGVLSAVGRINPVTYSEELLVIVPYGIYREEAMATNTPITQLIGQNQQYKKILWFGGIYPWFDLRELVNAVSKVNQKVPAKLIIVGAKNPFNGHPDFLRKYDELVSFISENNLDNLVILKEWVSFSDRANWYLDSDLVVVMNREGLENSLAWRTRLVDFMWADLPIITNGGDPLGEELILAGAAARFSGSLSQELADDLCALLADDKALKTLKKNLTALRPKYYWDTVTKELHSKIINGTRAKDLETMGIYKLTEDTARSGKVTRLMRKAKKIPAYARKHGTRNTVKIIGGIANRKLARYLPSSHEARLVFVSHQLDMSGAPFVLMDMVQQVAQSNPTLAIDFITFVPVHHQNVSALNRLGIKPKIIMDRQVVPEFNNNDVVVLNTSAHSEGLKEELFSRLESGRLTKLVWYIHEDDPELVFRPDERHRMTKLLRAGKLKILIAAKKMLGNYIHSFGTDEGIIYQTYKIVTEPKFHRVLKSNDFKDKLSFVLSGTVGDGRKGQLPVFYAFAAFYEEFFKKDPDSYREFELVFVGIIQDFLSRQLLKHKEAFTPDRFTTYGHVTKQENLAIVAKSNFTICYSIRECLPLFVFEGMISGHPLLRNDCSGVDEQLKDGENGYLVPGNDYRQLVETIERVLNKNTTSNEALAAMSQISYDMAKAQERNSYLPGLADEINYIKKEATHAQK
jgi:glycosyltransferase involved in cell wall biosynthesis